MSKSTSDPSDVSFSSPPPRPAHWVPYSNEIFSWLALYFQVKIKPQPALFLKGRDGDRRSYCFICGSMGFRVAVTQHPPATLPADGRAPSSPHGFWITT